MTNPVGIAAPPYIATPQPVRQAPLPAPAPVARDAGEDLIFPLGRPAIPLPIEAMLPYRDPDAENGAPSPEEKAKTDLKEAIDIVAPTDPDPNTLDMRVPPPVDRPAA